tara:strand:- start:318 stop:2009 length:1692 start_codon:yes stop_codon:yes gene_type:complete
MGFNLKIQAVLYWLEKNRRALQVSMIPLISLMMFGVYIFVMETGGGQYAVSDLVFIPIVLSGLLYGAVGGAISAIICGIILGPFGPIDTSIFGAQLAANWVYRMAYFLLVGLLIGGYRDILRHYVSQLRWQSLHDSGTKLPNSYALAETIAQKRSQPKHNQNHFLVAFSLANANELACHFGGGSVEALISQIAQKIQTTLKAGTEVYRVQENMVCVLLEDTGTFELQERISLAHAYLQESLVFKKVNLHGDINIGILKFEKARKPYNYYIQRINQVVLHSIESHQPILTATAEEEDLEGAKNLELLGNLKAALESQKLEMHFQPKINLIDGSIISAEALIRWHHPKSGFIPPNKFIPRAEQSTLINEITMFALDQSLAQASKWKKEGLYIKVAVNVSARNISQPNFVHNVLQHLDKYELSGSHLELELTESVIMHNESNVLKVLNLLVNNGIEISIDDFGTGYTSLHYLHRFPFSKIKIDQSFVFELLNQESDISFNIIESTINLAHKMDLLVVAEGVEDSATLLRLQSMGCDMAQGYYIARPASADNFQVWHKGINGHFAIA